MPYKVHAVLFHPYLSFLPNAAFDIPQQSPYHIICITPISLPNNVILSYLMVSCHDVLVHENQINAQEISAEV